MTSHPPTPSRRRWLPAFLAALVAAIATGLGAGGLGAAVSTPTPVGAEPTDDGSTTDLDAEIQILGVDEDPDGAVVLDVAVPPAIGELAPVAANFAVTDGGQLVELAVERPTGPVDAVLVIDTSGSMSGAALTAATDAARSFVDTVPDDVRVGLISFGETVEVHREPTLDRDAVAADLDELGAADGETALWDAMAIAAELIGEGSGPRYLVVLSDGDDTVSATSPEAVVDGLLASSIDLYAVAIESPDTDLVELERAVGRVGGRFLPTDDVTQLGPLYADIAGRLGNRFRLRFDPLGTGNRTVVVSVAVGDALATARITIGDDGLVAPPAGPQLGTDQLPSADRVLGPVAATAPGLLGTETGLQIGAGAMFLALALGGLLIVRPAKGPWRVAAGVAGDRLIGGRTRLGTVADRIVARRDSDGRLDAALDAADIDLRAGEFVVGYIVATTSITLAVTAWAGTVAGIVTAGTVIGGVALVMNIRTARRRARFGDQLTDGLTIMASGLRAGLSLPRAVELVGIEAPSPLADEFRRISFEVRLGRDLTDSIEDVARRMASVDLEWVAGAVDIHRELGGNLTEILDNVAATIRERRTISRQIDAMSAEGRLTGWVLLAMPVIVFLFTAWRTPDHLDPLLNETTGRTLLGGSGVGLAVGHAWIRRLVKLRY